jgi:diguanylate cyclase (GGDEF)-like protein
MEFAESLRSDIAKLGVTISIGVAVAPDDGREAEELFVQADRAMYEAKKEGGNRVRRFY